MVASTPSEFAAFIVAERTRYEAIVRDAGMTVD
jgi:tripartite-type tricarboxylate transporter receptor subunit TctC